MLVVELAGQDQGPAAAVHARPTRRRSCSSPTSARPACSRASTTSRSIPNFATNHYYYVFYTLGTPEPRPALALHGQRDADRHGRRAASSCSTRIRRTPTPSTTAARSTSATTASSTSRPASTSTPRAAQDLTSPRGKIHRINPDGTVPTDNPFYDGAGPELSTRSGPRPAQPVPRLLRRADRAAVHRRRRRQRLLDRDRGGRPRRARAPTTAGRTARAPCARAVHRARSTPTRTTGATPPITGGFVYHGTPVPEQLPGQLLLRRLHAELDQAPDVRRQRQRQRRLQLRAAPTARSTARTATSST